MLTDADLDAIEARVHMASGTLWPHACLERADYAALIAALREARAALKPLAEYTGHYNSEMVYIDCAFCDVFYCERGASYPHADQCPVMVARRLLAMPIPAPESQI